MAYIFFVLCASALFVQTISAQCIPAPTIRSGCGAPSSWNGAGPSNFLSSVSSSGGGFSVSSTSPISPNGISVLSQNDIAGSLNAVGQLPVLSAVGFECSLPTSGSAGTTYSCGNGQVGIDSNSLAAAGVGAGNGFGGNNAALGFGNGGCGAPVIATPCGFN